MIDKKNTTDVKKTVIVGASNNPGRYAYLAAQMLTDYGHEIVPVGIKTGDVLGHAILDLKTKPAVENVHTITMYVGTQNQSEWYDYLLSLRPKRIIFNPGTENREFEQRAEKQDIEVVEGCTLVMLRSGQF